MKRYCNFEQQVDSLMERLGNRLTNDPNRDVDGLMGDLRKRYNLLDKLKGDYFEVGIAGLQARAAMIAGLTGTPADFTEVYGLMIQGDNVDLNRIIIESLLEKKLAITAQEDRVLALERATTISEDDKIF